MFHVEQRHDATMTLPPFVSLTADPPPDTNGTGKGRVHTAEEIAAEKARICEWVRAGKTLLSYHREPDALVPESVRQWRLRWPDFDAEFREARKEGAHALAEQCLEIADAEPGRVAPSGAYDSAEISWKNVQIATRKSVMAAWNRAEYGDKLAVDQTVKRSVEEMSDEELQTYLRKRGEK